jgi:SulP family sulfate permease
MGDKPFLGLVAPFVPAVGWIRAYKPKEFPQDLVAGLSLAAFVIPESLAYASLAQLPPVTGLYCYLVAGIAYAVFGTSRQLAVGPTSALAITVATSVVAMGAMAISPEPLHSLQPGVTPPSSLLRAHVPLL